MKTSTLIRRSLRYYWRTNLAVVAGVATAVAVLAGALLVGESVRSSLRNMLLGRLGNTGSVVVALNFFRAELGDKIGHSCPLISLEGVARHQPTGRLATGVQIYGVDDRFWDFHGQEQEGPNGREVYLSEAMARELECQAGEGVLLRFEEPSYIPAESLQGKKEESGRTVRFSAAKVLTPGQLGEFSLRAGQGAVKAAFVSLSLLEDELSQPDRVNTLLLSPEALDAEERIREDFALADLGVRVRYITERGILQVESLSGVLSDELATEVLARASEMDLPASGLLSYLANTIRSGEREIPYSLVLAREMPSEGDREQTPITLNQWAADDLSVNRGDSVTLEYYRWNPGGRLTTHQADFSVTGIEPVVPDRDAVPDYPGITDSDDVTDWDPPFPVDLSRIRPRDEEYWDHYRTTPKAFIPLEAGQKLWESEFGKLTAIRLRLPEGADAQAVLDEYRRRLRDSLDPLALGMSVIPVREQGLAGSRGATDFGEYFVYFSFFLVVSALLLAGLFFRLGAEQRVRETGLLEAVGIPRAGVRRVLAGEGLILALVGAALGVVGAILYCELILYGLRTWWLDAVGTQEIRLQTDPLWLVAGAVGGVLAAYLALMGTLRLLARISPRNRLAGVVAPPSHLSGASGRARMGGVVTTAIAALLLGASAAGLVPDVAGFFGAGILLLAAGLFFLRSWAGGKGLGSLGGTGFGAVARLGVRNATHRPGRTTLSVALLASAVFLIVSVDAFRLSEPAAASEPRSPTGGFPLMAESALPIYSDPSAEEGREKLGLEGINDVAMTPFRLRPGDDISCLNLYRPQDPRVLGARRDFLESSRFLFHSSLAESPGDRDNPWLLLLREPEDDAIPAAVSANSLTYVLHRKLGDEIEIPVSEGSSVRLRLVAALADNIFQRELLISEENFRRYFAGDGGFRVFLIDAPAGSVDEVATELEDRLSDFGFDVVATLDKLAGFHRVENTYLSTFQSLGALGLALGTIGLGVILLRNVLERRRELALLRAVGYRPGHVGLVVIAESAFLLGCGVVIGTVTAILAITPALLSRGGSFSGRSLALLLAVVLLSGLLSSLVAARAAVRSPLLESLRQE